MHTGRASRGSRAGPARVDFQRWLGGPGFRQNPPGFGDYHLRPPRLAKPAGSRALRGFSQGQGWIVGFPRSSAKCSARGGGGGDGDAPRGAEAVEMEIATFYHLPGWPDAGSPGRPGTFPIVDNWFYFWYDPRFPPATSARAGFGYPVASRSPSAAPFPSVVSRVILALGESLVHRERRGPRGLHTAC